MHQSTKLLPLRFAIAPAQKDRIKDKTTNTTTNTFIVQLYHPLIIRGQRSWMLCSISGSMVTTYNRCSCFSTAINPCIHWPFTRSNQWLLPSWSFSIKLSTGIFTGLGNHLSQRPAWIESSLAQPPIGSLPFCSFLLPHNTKDISSFLFSTGSFAFGFGK